MLNQVHLHFYGDLNDFLPEDKRNTGFTHHLKKPGSIKDLIESIGVPHTEIDLIFVNDASVDFNYQVRHGDNIRIYPPPEFLAENEISSLPLNNKPIIHNHPRTNGTPRFILDVHLGRLAAYLRIMGFDTLYRNDYDDQTLARISDEDSRTLLTCDRKLLMRKQVSHGYFVRQRLPRRQLQEVISRFDLLNKQQDMTRCSVCNGEIVEVEKSDIEHCLLPKTRKYYNEFFQCASCNKIYWEGSHYQNMQEMVNKLKDNSD